jgi:AbrB family looped-hinge helix DNA binding protein
MVQRVEVEVDEQGRIAVPTVVRDRLALKPGMTLVVEQELPDRTYLRVRDDDEPQLVEKNGIWVIEGELTEDIGDPVRKDRDERVRHLVQQAAS